MATSKRSYDTDLLTVRQIFAFNPNDTYISSGRILVTTSNGQTTWAEPSSIPANPAFNRVTANGINLTADTTFNTLTVSTLNGLGMDVVPASKQIYLFNKAFTQFDISGGNTIYGYQNNTVTPTVKFVGQSGINITADPLTNTLCFQGVPTEITTGTYAYNQIKVIPKSQTLNTALAGETLTAPGITSRLNVIGLNDIVLSTNITSNAFTISISSFTSEEYLQISTLAGSNVSTVSTLFYDTVKIGDATSSLLYTMTNMSTGIHSRIAYDSTYFTTFYTTLDVFSNVSTGTTNKVNSKVNFTSSIGVRERGSVQLGTSLPEGLQFSSATFSLSTMSTFVNNNANIEIRENLNIILDSNNTLTKNDIYTVSSFLMMNDTFLPSTVYTRPLMAPNDAGSNILSDTVFMNLDFMTLQNNTYNGEFKIVHRINNFNLTSLNASNALSEKNGVSVRFWRTN